MLKIKIPPYLPERCHCCNQTTTYLLPLDKGAVDIVKAIAVAIRKKGVNIIHPRKEMEVEKKLDYQTMIREGLLTSNQVGNLSKARFHGMIAHIKDNRGNYCLTTKGAEFLKGTDVPRFAIISKKDGHQIGYYIEKEARCKVRDFDIVDQYWEGIDFIIKEGRIVKQQDFTQPALI